MNGYYVYILTNKSRRVLYTGITNDMPRRLFEHKNKNNPNSFTAKYNVFYIIYYEYFENVEEAIHREKEIKNWTRMKKLDLIRNFNPCMNFLNKQFDM